MRCWPVRASVINRQLRHTTKHEEGAQLRLRRPFSSLSLAALAEVLLIKNPTQYDLERAMGYMMQSRGLGLSLSGFSGYKYAAPRVA